MTSLSLDARQRAMLQEMGITVWAPAEHPAPAPEAARAPAPVQTPLAAPTLGASTTATAPAPVASRAPAPAARPPATPPTAAPALSQSAAAQPGTALRLHDPLALYPTADPARTPAELGAGWHIVAETSTPAEPLTGDVGKLLDNMLRAMQLHKHPRVFLSALERCTPGAPEGADIPVALASTVQQLKPALVLVLGHVAARAALGRAEPLGRLRASPHQVAGCPAVVTYDPAFLLRQQDSKAAAWADLCAALATVRNSVRT